MRDWLRDVWDTQLLAADGFEEQLPPLDSHFCVGDDDCRVRFARLVKLPLRGAKGIMSLQDVTQHGGVRCRLGLLQKGIEVEKQETPKPPSLTLA